MPDPAAPGPVGADEDADDDDRRTEVALQHQEHQHAREHRGKRDERLPEVADLGRVLVDPVGDEDRERELAELRRLKSAERPSVKPAASAVHGHAKVRDEHEDHEERHSHGSRGSDRAQPAVVDAAQNEQCDETDPHPRGLALGVIESGLVLGVGERDARAGHHDQAGTAQQDRGEEQQSVGQASVSHKSAPCARPALVQSSSCREHLVDEGLELVAPVFVVLEHVEALVGGAQQHDAAEAREAGRDAHGLLEA